MAFTRGFKKTAKVAATKPPKKKVTLYLTGTKPSENPNASTADGQAVGAMWGGNTHSGW
jgi:hypothetical protein